ncbi:hypothetical protein Tco_1410962 [Tanacetum coccineum]
MVAYLKKIKGSEGFQKIVDFLNASHIRYALTENPTIYVSLINQFWQTAITSTLDNEEIEITATIDGKVKIVTEASIRRHLKLEDTDGISILPTTEIFEQLALMGYVSNSDKLSPLIHVTESEVPQPRSPTQTYVADEAASTGVDVRHGGVATTVTSLDAGQGSSNIDKTPYIPHDSPLPRVNILRSDEGSITLNELMVLCTTLSKKVESLEADLKQTKKVYGAAYTKLIKKVKRLERAAKSNSQDMEFETEVYTAEELVSTAGASMPVSTAGMVQEVNISIPSPIVVKDKGKAIVEADEELTQRLQAEERNKYSEVDQAKMLHMGTHTLQQLKRLSFDELKNLFEATMRRVSTFVTIETKIRRGVPELVENSSQEAVTESTKAEDTKRSTKEELDEQSSKKQKTDELSQEELQQLMIIVPKEGMNSLVQERFNSTEPTEDKEIELWVELKRLFEPDADDELWMSHKHVHDLTWRLYDTCGVHHVSTKDGVDIYMLVEREYPLSRGVLTQMLSAKLLVEQNNEISRELLRKIFMQAERPRR